jgi:hypothetical protein
MVMVAIGLLPWLRSRVRVADRADGAHSRYATSAIAGSGISLTVVSIQAAIAAAKHLAAVGDDGLIWPEFRNAGDDLLE